MQGSISISRPKAQLNPIQKGLAVLRKYGANAHMWLPGVGYINGQQLGNWVDSTGITAASVDNPVGLVIDQGVGASAILQDLTRNNDFSSGATYWTPGSGWTVSNGSATHDSAGGTSAITQSGLTVGNYYKMTVYSPNPVGFNALFGGTYVSITWVGNVGTAYGICSVNGNFGVQGGGNITITKIVCQQVLGALGQNSIANSDFSNGITGWTANNSATVAVVSGVLSVTNTAASYGGAYTSVPTIVGTTYIVKYRAWITSGTLSWLLIGTTAGGNTIATITLPSSQPFVDLTYVFVATSTTTYFTFQNNNTSGFALSANGITCQQVLGISATQATTANKPTLRRGAVNILQYSTDFTNAAWSKANSTLSVGVADPAGGTSAVKLVSSATTNGMYVRQSGTFSFVGGLPYTVAAVVKADGFNQAYVMGYDGGGDRGAVFDLTTGLVKNAYSSPTQSSVSLGNGWWLCVINITPQTTPTANLVDVRLAQGGVPGSVVGDGIQGIDLYGAALIQGTMTATQILQCGGISLTTTTAASSMTGNWGWEGDGSAKYLPLGSLPFQMIDDHIVVAGGRCDSGSANRSFFGIRSTSSTTPIVGQLGFTAGLPDAVWRDDAGALFRATSGTTRVGQACVLSLRRNGGLGVLRVNGAQSASVSLTPGTTTVTSAAIGGVTTTTAGNLLPGVTNMVVAIKGNVPDTDLLTIERMVGAFTGPTGVKF